MPKGPTKADLERREQAGNAKIRELLDQLESAKRDKADAECLHRGALLRLENANKTLHNMRLAIETYACVNAPGCLDDRHSYDPDTGECIIDTEGGEPFERLLRLLHSATDPCPF